MAPNLLSNSIVLADAQIDKDETISQTPVKSKQASHQSQHKTYKMQIVWLNVALMTYLHLSALYGVFLLFTKAKWATWLFTYFYMIFCGLGITAGAHRLWSHKAYNARWPLRLILMIAQTSAHQNSIFDWVRDHRVHHKYTDTDADPYNAKRGFFFSHVGWLMAKKHPEVIAKGKMIDMSDILADPIVRFQKKYFIPLMVFNCFFLTTFIPMYFWGESLSCAWYCSTIFRYCFGLNATWLVNSAAHIWGMKPYEKSISPSNNPWVAGVALGEGWHNYHHVFPWDYKTAELGNYGSNWTTAFIDFFSNMGWAYNLKTVSTETIKRRILRTGDGSHDVSKENFQDSFKNFIDNFEHKEEEMVWGWDDKDLTQQDRKDAKIIN